jgi:hypothetical protein
MNCARGQRSDQEWSGHRHPLGSGDG